MTSTYTPTENAAHHQRQAAACHVIVAITRERQVWDIFARDDPAAIKAELIKYQQLGARHAAKARQYMGIE